MQHFDVLKRSISSTQDLQSVVRTMKTLAAVSIRQYEQAVESLEDFSETVELGLKMVLLEMNQETYAPELQKDGPPGIIIFGSDQGMCGQFNEQIVTYAMEHLTSSETAFGQLAWMSIGSRIEDRLRDSGREIDFRFSQASSATGISPLVSNILLCIDRWRNQRQLGEIRIFYNRRVSASSYKPHAMQLWPMSRKRFFQEDHKAWPSRSLPFYTMPRPILLSRLIRQFLFVTLFRACAESLAGENASRIASMQAAEHNIGERLFELQSEFNQQRQTAITEELLDVVTGFEALKDS
ncbi:MAG: F0F1 ATP synthase subunit gamma [Planctomycetaceae bacterium]|nr:F0F1 ATP synthase subunit gamma [Planctomycetaceae bacterium]